MLGLCDELGLDLNEVMGCQPYFMRVWDYAEEELITIYENE